MRIRFFPLGFGSGSAERKKIGSGSSCEYFKIQNKCFNFLISFLFQFYVNVVFVNQRIIFVSYFKLSFISCMSDFLSVYLFFWFYFCLFVSSLIFSLLWTVCPCFLELQLISIVLITYVGDTIRLTHLLSEYVRQCNNDGVPVQLNKYLQWQQNKWSDDTIV